MPIDRHVSHVGNICRPPRRKMPLSLNLTGFDGWLGTGAARNPVAVNRRAFAAFAAS